VSDSTRCLVVENDPTDDPRRLGEWLTAAGLDPHVLRPYAGDPLPAGLDGWAAFVVLGGDQHAYPSVDGAHDAEWFPPLEGLLRKAVRANVPTLGVCLGAQLLAVAHAGTVQPAAAGPEIGAHLVAKRDLADRDPLFAPLPMLPDVVQWHHDEVTELPLGAVLLATSPKCPNQAFRVGRCGWGVQFHIECDTEMIAGWAETNGPVLAALGVTAESVVAGVDAIRDDLFEAWQPMAQRFAMVARGELPLPEPAPLGSPGRPVRELPLLGG
jgi:GMP synthase-like glutamine amidotransferase